MGPGCAHEVTLGRVCRRLSASALLVPCRRAPTRKPTILSTTSRLLQPFSRFLCTMSVPNPDLPSYDPETYSTVRPGTNPEAFNRPHNEPRRNDDDSNLALPRWAIFLIIFIPVMLFCMGVTIFYLNRHRRAGIKRAISPVELQDLEAQRHPTPAPSLPELYWPGVYPPEPPPAGSERGPLPPPNREPQPPRKRFNPFDKILPDLPPAAPAPRGTDNEDKDEWETVPGTSRQNLEFEHAFKQHRRDREAEASANQRLFEQSAQRQQQQDRNPRVNDGYSKYRSYNYAFSGSDTDVILASDTNTMTNTYTTTDHPYRARRHNDGFVPHRNVIPDDITNTISPSSLGFPSQESEMSGYAETTVSNDPWGEEAVRNRRLQR